jgi:hypothetical protein
MDALLRRLLLMSIGALTLLSTLLVAGAPGAALLRLRRFDAARATLRYDETPPLTAPAST